MTARSIDQDEDVTNQLFPCQIQLFKGGKTRDKRKAVFEAVFYLLGVGLDHDVAVDEDRADDGAGEEGVGEHVDGDPVRQDDEDVEEEEDYVHFSYFGWCDMSVELTGE